MSKTKFRIIESREACLRNDVVDAHPIYHIEERFSFLFFCWWERLSVPITDLEVAREITKSLQKQRDFKPKILK